MSSHINSAYINDNDFSKDDEFVNGGIFNQALHKEKAESKTFNKKTIVAILCLINLINYVDRFTLAGTLKDVQEYYSLGNTEAGLIQTSFICSYMIMAPVFGYLGDRYSRKKIIAFGVLFWSMTTLLGSFIPRHLFGIFIFLRALVGTGEASYSTIAPTIIGDLFSKDKRSTMLAIFYFAIPFGSGFGYIVGDSVTQLTGEWQWALRVTPAIGFLCVALTFIFVKDPPRGEAEGGTNFEHSTITADLLDLCKTKSPGTIKSSLIFGVITCFAGIIGVIIGTTASQHFRRKNPRADPLICGFGVLISVPLIFFGVIYSEHSQIVSWILIFLGEVCLCVNWTIVADMLLYVIVPTRRSIAEAVQILVSHALGDASSPYIIGLVSDGIAHSSTNEGIHEYLSLQYALYIPTAVLVIGAYFFFLTAKHIEKDKTKCSLATHASEKASYLPSSSSSLQLDEKRSSVELTSL
ncbi:protein spinster homolog 1 [Caerostris extrusa]|uniref:Protein spinster homolog 1 n=1 Tax=Caerostris extrusa TaxID=172846 RepID=A0AAV4T885_CAEEX|nr:protein spinster homolog 1 [Caerostris extrusa]